MSTRKRETVSRPNFRRSVASTNVSFYGIQPERRQKETETYSSELYRSLGGVCGQVIGEDGSENAECGGDWREKGRSVEGRYLDDAVPERVQVGNVGRASR